jgi:hypothetical protein
MKNEFIGKIITKWEESVEGNYNYKILTITFINKTKVIISASIIISRK